MSYGNNADLSHWDFAEEFSGLEVASLILGIDPLAIQQNTATAYPEANSDQRAHDFQKITLVLNRLRESYFTQLGILQCRLPMMESLQELRTAIRDDPCTIAGSGMFHLYLEKSVDAASKRIAGEEFLDFDKQKFFRPSIENWIDVSGFKSKYKFNLNVKIENQRDENQNKKLWPWGHYNTELLGQLNAAAQRFWVNYDPSDPTTAPTNAAVSDWLQTNHKISRTMAGAIASILRADGLPTGPRK